MERTTARLPLRISFDERPTEVIHIVTDSTCEGPAELLQHPAVEVVPLSVVFGREALRDRIEICADEFWDRLPKSNPLPTTSQATPGDFEASFRRITDAGDEVLAITLSHKFSGTYDSAVAAQESLAGRPIDVFDSMSVSIGLGLTVRQALKMVEAGATRAEIIARLTRMRDQIHILFALETLEYLQKGGRIGRGQAFVGTLLKFKPLLGIRDGEVFPATRVRTKRKALETMLDLLADEVPARGPQVKLAVVHACAAEEAAEVGEALKARFGSADLFMSTLGPVIGVHVGPGTVGAAVYADEQ